MTRPKKKPQLIEFKGMTLPVVSVTLHSLQADALTQAANELFGDDAFFDNDAAVLELDLLDPTKVDDPVDWPCLLSLFAKHGLRIIGVRGGSETLHEGAAKVGLPSFAAFKRPTRNAGEAASVTQENDAEDIPVLLPENPPENTEAQPQPESAPEPAPAPAQPAQPAFPASTRVIDRPLRSGQQVYARGGDLVVLAAVNAGAEVIADGSIHIYAPLRGRALAGASGDNKARIFTTRFEAELVSIAGVYRTFESGIPNKLGGQPVQVQLSETEGETSSRLSIEALRTD